MVAWTRSAELDLGWESFGIQITQLTKNRFKGINHHLFNQPFRPLKNIFFLFATYSSWFQVKVFLFTDNATEALSSANRKPFLICVGAKPLQCVWLVATLWTAACEVPLSMGFSRKDCWSGLPCPPPGHLFNPGIQPASLMSPALAGRVTSATWCYSGTWCFKSPLSFTKINFPLLSSFLLIKPHHQRVGGKTGVHT